MQRPSNQKKPSWLPTNLRRDFTVLTPFVERVDAEGQSEGQATYERRAVGRTFQDYICGDRVRVQACPCYEGRARSVTVRTKKYKFEPYQAIDLPPDATYSLCSGYQPDPEVNNKYLVSVYETCWAVYEALRLIESPSANGLLIISGSTNSMKTNLAMGLIHLVLEQLMTAWLRSKGMDRKPHLVTCEDNIEQHLFELHQLQRLETCFSENTKVEAESGLWLSSLRLPDYTPRLRNMDTVGLADAVDDALRMTPAVFYAGEIRSTEDWAELMRLGESHLVVATTHASSLINTFGRLGRNLNVLTPAQRSEMSASIRGVVHMRGLKLDLKSSGTAEVVLPTCWVRTSGAVAAFTSDGVASMTPYFADLAAQRCEDNVFCLGRRSFASAFWGFASESHPVRRPPPTCYWSRLPESRKFETGEDRAAALNRFLDPVDCVSIAPPGKRPEVKSTDGTLLMEMAASYDLRGE